MRHLIPASFIQDVLTRSDIVNVIQSRVPFVKKGHNYMACCPFHEEKTPSFSVNQQKQFYYCFGCSAGGNAINFLMTFDHMDFREAVTYLASQLGLEVPTTQTPEQADYYQRLYRILEEATGYYEKGLRHNKKAIDYLKSRGLSGEIAKRFSLGYASSEWQALQDHIGQRVDQKKDLIASGLVIEKNQHSYDRFRERIIFPVRNVRGQVIGFGGRTITDAQPKYINSPETPLFHKGTELYGLYEARQYANPLKQLLVVEGYMDVIALHQHDIHYAVATLGTAITPQQIQKLLRYASRLIFCFDSDRAGKQAAWKALTTTLPLLREGIHIYFLYLPEQEDPDSAVRKLGREAFTASLEKATPLSEAFFAELRRQMPIESSADKAQFGQQVAQYLNTIPPGLLRELLYQELADQLQMDTASLLRLLQPALPKASTTRPRSHPILQRQVLPPVHLAISLILQQPHLADWVSDKEWLSSVNLPEKDLLVDISDKLHQHPEMTTGELLVNYEGSPRHALIATLAARTASISGEDIKTEFKEVLAHLKQQSTEQYIQELIEKAKKSQLNLQEKRKLQTLLSTIKGNTNDRY